MNVSILDYGLGNLRSVEKAFNAIGISTKVVKDPDEVIKAERLVLPGVGAFRDGMEGIKKRNLLEPVIEFAGKNRPILGICLGMQLMFEESEEFGHSKGLGLIPGEVVFLKSAREINMPGYRVPHIGWSKLLLPDNDSGSMGCDKDDRWRGSMLSDLKVGEEVYFAHSCVAKVRNPHYVLSISGYGGQKFCAAVKKDNLMGCQFHPEKSGRTGLNILKHFAKM